MKSNIISSTFVALLVIGFSSCSEETPMTGTTQAEGRPQMQFSFNMSGTRVTDTAFENGDKVGLFVNESSSPLEIAGNTVNNEMMTLTGTEWEPTRQLYWDKGAYDATAYYPFMEDVSSISDLPFSVATDQSADTSALGLSGYEASDFLYASVKGIEAQATPVSMTFSHIMSKISIRLIKGEDFEGDMPEKAIVYLHNTVTDATIDLSAGVVTKDVKATGKTITACPAGNDTYTAIVVPQRLENRVPLIEVIMNGVSYLYESKFLFKPGVHHSVNLVVDKNPEQLKIEIGGEIVGWN